MPTSTAIGYNTGSTIVGTQQIGNLAVVTATTANPSLSPNGIKFWMGPDEDLGYVVGLPVSGGTQPTPIGGLNAFLGFLRSSNLTENSFVLMVDNSFGQNLVTGNAAKTWLNNNGYWTSWTSNTNVEVFTTSGTWSKPSGVTQVIVECWGGGGAGGGGAVSGGAGAGGAGGQYSRKTITYSSPSQNISYVVASAVSGTSESGTTGNQTSWNNTEVVARGGRGGNKGTSVLGGTNAAGSGSTVGGIGDIVYRGGNGGSGLNQGSFNNAVSGQGGGGAGSNGNGSDEALATSELGGAGGPQVFRFDDTKGISGSNYGGGGSGGIGAGGTGGNGAQGLIRISY